jgi:hypothetical protein
MYLPSNHCILNASTVPKPDLTVSGLLIEYLPYVRTPAGSEPRYFDSPRDNKSISAHIRA